MRYFEEIKSGLENHIEFVKSIPMQNSYDSLSKKIERHLEYSIEVDKAVDKEEPRKLKKIIDYLEKEGRFFGWSFPENENEEACENSFWNFKDKMKKLIGGMTGNERLFYFGYLEEYEKTSIAHKTARDEILSKLFM